jgi:hypothetical protein
VFPSLILIHTRYLGPLAHQAVTGKLEH